MSPVLSADGEKTNWVNYKTGEKNIFFRLAADNKKASVTIELSHKDLEIQQIVYEHFLSLKRFLSDAAGEEWNWQLHGTDENGRVVSRIYTERSGVSIFKKEDWPELIRFFKAGIIALDEFWSNVKYSFEDLR